MPAARTANAQGIEILYVCARPDHHRRRARETRPVEHLGCAAYCPAGDLGGHEWMPTQTDLTRLQELSICPGACSDTQAEPPGRPERELVLIRD